MASQNKPVVWTIGGSDSAGGAGIQADMLSVNDFGVHCCQLVTAVTAQNSQTVSNVFPMQIGMLRAQWDALLADIPPSVIKIGMVTNNHQLDWLCGAITQLKRDYPDTLVVWDPVLKASVGAELNSASLDTLLALARLVDVITPNRTELEYLTESVINSEDTLLLAARQLLAMGTGDHRAVIAKGGHANWQQDIVVDYLVTNQPLRRFVHQRVSTPHQHGTGCTFASAFAALLAQDFNLEDSMCAALAYVSQGLDCAYAIGQGSGPVAHMGWPNQASFLPMVEFDEAPLAELSRPFLPCVNPDLGLYPVVGDIRWIARLLKAGVKTLQLRLKNLPIDECEAQIKQAVALGQEYDAQLFINDYWQLALKHGAYGVHLGQEDLATADLSAIAQAGLRLGVSTHGFAEIARVLPLKPSYVALGHIFPTKTKDMPSRPQGVARLSHYVKVVGEVPTVAIGGINCARFEMVKATGVSSIAMVTAITEAADPEAVVATLMEQMDA